MEFEFRELFELLFTRNREPMPNANSKEYEMPHW
jgi:hypothetical protein